MSRVFVISAPHGKNLEPAKEFGPLTVMLDGHETAIMAQDRLNEYLYDIRPQDYLLLIGNPLHIAIAAQVARKQLGGQGHPLKVLIWDRESQTYTEEKIYA